MFNMTECLEVWLVQKPVVLNISPNFIDAKQTASQWVQIRGKNFFNDTGLPSDSPNIHCLINSLPVDVRFNSSESLECLLTPTLGLERYFVTLSTNFGHQWIEAADLPILTTDIS